MTERKEIQAFIVFIFMLGFISGVICGYVLKFGGPTYVHREQLIYNVCPKLADNIRWCP